MEGEVGKTRLAEYKAIKKKVDAKAERRETDLPLRQLRASRPLPRVVKKSASALFLFNLPQILQI